MLSLLVLGIYLLLSGDGERAEWNHFLHGGSVKDEGDNYGVSILTSITWRLLFPNGDIKGEMIKKKKEVSQLRLHECWPSFVGYVFSGLLPIVCLCGHPYCKASYKFGFKIWSYSQRGYNLDKSFWIFV
uniref:Uncharacterized protein n=1 Tax=Saccharum officinarum TaxID=4547 RepID=A0A678TQ16_SACOF|nr:hypothetical protein SO33D14_000009 [Saccharum officinarum]